MRNVLASLNPHPMRTHVGTSLNLDEGPLANIMMFGDIHNLALSIFAA
jgi:hypothetical protein